MKAPQAFKDKVAGYGLGFAAGVDDIVYTAAVSSHAAEIERLRERVRTISVVELMAENPNVDSHVREWESRCLKAEERVRRLEEELKTTLPYFFGTMYTDATIRYNKGDEIRSILGGTK